mmetsp:Transcript_71251/g.112860  ORF Transcript_71251/g.112860 Transcript_71251/m.112860 type:complete len:82 (-) Transcript_71251:59-304(-)
MIGSCFKALISLLGEVLVPPIKTLASVSRKWHRTFFERVVRRLNELSQTKAIQTKAREWESMFAVALGHPIRDDRMPTAHV